MLANDKKKLAPLKESKIMLSVVNERDYFENVREMIQYITEKLGYGVCYITSNKPAFYLLDEFNKRGMKTDKITFIDSVSCMLCKNAPRDNVLYAKAPQDFVGISLAVTEALERHKKMVFVLDSLPTFLVYAEPNVVTRFAHFLINKIRFSNNGAVFLTTRSEEYKVYGDLYTFVDSVIEVGGK